MDLVKRSESEIQKAILEALNRLPDTFAFRVSSTGIPDAKSSSGFRRNPNKGISDIIVCKRGKIIALEVKSATGKATESQYDFLRAVVKAKGQASIVHSVEEAMDAWEET